MKIIQKIMKFREEILFLNVDVIVEVSLSSKTTFTMKIKASNVSPLKIMEIHSLPQF